MIVSAWPPGERRDEWIDVLRAFAIVSVAAYHVVQMSPEPMAAAWQLLQHGHLGVDLFFVISGWLIGTLYWREAGSAGQVDVWRFWQRRWWRTLPGYAIALALSWTAVSIARGEPFDWGYLFFAQNYYETLPFFLISWSLCVEEHFYLMMPILLWAARRARLPLPLLFVCLGVLPMLLRWYGREAALGAGFGLPYTATHLRMEGLVLAFWASRWSVVGGERWIKLRDAARPLLLALVPATVWAFAWSPASRYVLSGTLIAVSFATMLLAGVGRVRLGRINGLVHSVAIRSYSIYLTHALGIHVARQASLRIDGGSAVSYLAIVSALIISAGWMFHSVVEQPVLRLRERFAPNRTERAESAQVALSSLRSP